MTTAAPRGARPRPWATGQALMTPDVPAWACRGSMGDRGGWTCFADPAYCRGCTRAAHIAGIVGRGVAVPSAAAPDRAADPGNGTTAPVDG